MSRFALAKWLQGAGLAVLALLLLRVVGPWLVDMHSTPALILAALLLIGGVCLVGWFVWSLVSPRRPR